MKKDKKWFVDKWTEERDKSAVHDPMYHFINEFITDVKELDEPEVLSKEWVNNNVVHVRGLGDIFEAETVENLIVPKQELPVSLYEETINIVLDDLKEYIKEQQSLSQNAGLAHTSAGNDTHYRQYDYVLECINEYEPSDELHNLIIPKQEVLSQEWVDRNKFEVNGWNEAVHVEDLQNLLVPKQGLPVIPKYVADWIKDLKSKGINMLESIYDFNHGEDINNYMREQGDVLMRAWLDGFTIAIEEEPLYYALVKGHELSNNEFKYWSCKAYNSGHLFVGSKYPKASCINRITKNNWNKLGINESNADFVEVAE